MSTFGTCKTKVSELTGIALTGGKATAIEHAIIDAINARRAEELPFNVSALSITPLTVGVANADTGRKYVPGAGAGNLPDDFLQPLDDLWIRHDTTTNDRSKMQHVQRTRYDELRADHSEENGDPAYWTLIGKDLWITPAPDATTMQILGRYIMELPTPTTSSADSLASDWFEPGLGLEVISSMAASYLMTGHMNNPQQGQGFLGISAQLLAAQHRETGRRERTDEIQPYYFGNEYPQAGDDWPWK